MRFAQIRPLHVNKGEMNKAVGSNDLVKKEGENESLVAFKQCHRCNGLQCMNELTP